MSHNKKGNVAFLFECLTRELTKSVLKKDMGRQSLCRGLIREHFKQNSQLSQELEVFQTLATSKGLDLDVSNILLQELKRKHEKIDKELLSEEITNLVLEMSHKLGKDIYQTFVPTYQTLATVSQIFSEKTKTKDRVLLEKKIVALMMEKEIKREMVHGDKIFLKTFSKKFNDKYKDLNESQKTLLFHMSQYEVNSPEFKSYLIKELRSLKEKVAKIDSPLPEVMSKKEQISELLEGYSKIPVTDVNFKKILELQELSEEVGR